MWVNFMVCDALWFGQVCCTLYFVVGVVVSLLLDVLYPILNVEPNTTLQKAIAILLWPIVVVVFVFGFIKQLTKSNRK